MSASSARMDKVAIAKLSHFRARFSVSFASFREEFKWRVQCFPLIVTPDIVTNCLL